MSDAEIIAHLSEHQPATNSEKNVWAFWDRGLANCPGWCQRNIVSWVRRLAPSWTVRVLDCVEDSPVHISKYIDRSFFPQVFNQQKMSGPHVGSHTADLVRLPLLYLYGGVWLDVGFFLFRNLDDLCWNVLMDPMQPFEMAGFRIAFSAERNAMFNGFIAACKGNPCIKHWHDICLKIWRGRTTTTGMHKHPLLRHLPRYEASSAQTSKAPPFQYEQYVDYVVQIFCLERLRHLRDPTGDTLTGAWDGPCYFKTKVLLYDCVQEVYWAQRLTGWNGRKQFELLSTPREGADTVRHERYDEAKAFVEGLLATSSTMKLSRSLAVPGIEYLADIWNTPENRGADNEPGTFAAYLRSASVHFEQKRELVRVEMPVCEDAVLVGPIAEVEGGETAKSTC